MEISEQYIETVHKEELILSALQYLLASRTPLKMEFPRTHFSWVTFLLDVRSTGNQTFLLIDNVKKFEQALAMRPDREISLEFKEKEGVPCLCRTKVIKKSAEGIWAELPKSIQRIQRRKDFRLEPPSDSKITLTMSSGETQVGNIQNVSMGGVAFILKKETIIHVGDALKEVRLKIPEGDQSIDFYISEAVVLRIEKEFDYGKSLVAIKFTNISNQVREEILAYIFRVQREMIRKIGR
jgi:c-di-GMP-binding flagellar brake protein YcgR